ncbi:hypothetical protein D7V86_11405 [bacterium D16-51]|nr:hypothetical protein D7V96_12925 [bacterium D16-59]RKI59777.1 hypothetical protein D7V86_11405 [bacterium D16-51]
MEARTIIEFLQVLTLYTVCVCVAPYVVFHDLLREKCLAEKFILSVLIGNFYIINVVFIIFLLHIPGKGSLYLFTIVPAFVAWLRVNRPGVREYFAMLYTSLSRLFLGEAHFRTILGALLARPKKLLKDCFRSFFTHIRRHFLEWVMLLGLIGFNTYYYGYQTVTKYVFGASDLTVHQSWINNMDGGTIFCNGVYPFGFHNIIWFLHKFFGLRTLSILRVFGVVETLFIYMMIYLLLRKLCKSRYLPVFGVFLFTLPDLFDFQATMRYQWSLPQEFGMIFLYPCAFYLVQFFERKKEEIQTKKRLKQEDRLYAWMDQYHIMPSTRSLTFFAISFSLTLAAHFYITIIAFILCFAIAISYFPLVLHPKYFWSIALAGILSLFSAVAPMGVAFMQGVQPEGSLKWALSVIFPEEEKENITDTAGTGTSEQEAAPGTVSSEDGAEDETGTGNGPSGPENTETGDTSANNGSSFGNADVSDSPNTIWDKIKAIPGQIKYLPDKIVILAGKVKRRIIYINNAAASFLKGAYSYDELADYILAATEILAVFSLFMMFIRRKFYYRNLFSISLYTLILMVMYSAELLGLPAIMDLTRSRIFLAYATPLLSACLADAVYVVLCWPFRYHKTTELVPIGLTLTLAALTIVYDFIKPLNILYSLQLPGEMKCNYDIIENYPEKRWTVVTTTNSMQSLREKGWHMEICTFLGKMEDYNRHTTVTIPTKYVFFYIEKTPLDYGHDAYNLVTDKMANSGYVSETAASEQAVFGGSEVYFTENRYKLESKLYYWAKAFQQKFPEEFQVYYEDESFICYRIIQNEYQLYNFAVDYGFNS